MNQALFTVIAPLAPEALGVAEAAIDRMGNPADPSIRERLGVLDQEMGVHFMSLHALPSFTSGRAHLVLECTADGDERVALKRIVAAIGLELATVFALASDWQAQDDDVEAYLRKTEAYLRSHLVHCGHGLGSAPGLDHEGTPGKSVGSILLEADLARACTDILAKQPPNWDALKRLTEVRNELRRQGGWERAFGVADPVAAFKPATTLQAVFVVTLGLATTYLWPAWLLVAAWAIYQGVAATIRSPDHLGWLRWLGGVAEGAVTGVGLTLLAVAVAALLGYLRLRDLETHDWTSERSPDRAVLHEIISRENHCAQNHMVSLTRRKADWLRYFTQRLGFFIVATMNPMFAAPGYLAAIGTIHSARWVTVPGTRDLLFFSNYGGSWESYLEEFITLSSQGLTGIWSNTVGFPRTRNLLEGGGADGERFKRFARQSMLPTRFWYSAYPDLICDMVRANSAIRSGVAGAMTQDDAVKWLSNFGSAQRPEDLVETSEVQSLVFGGLGFLPYGALTLWRLSPQVKDARGWLGAVAPSIAYNDGRRVRDSGQVDAIVQVALSSRGLAALGLQDETLSTFPAAFLDDMTNAQRLRILGDTGENSPAHWWWGQEPAHVAALVFGKTAEAFDAKMREVEAIGRAHGALAVHQVDLNPFDAGHNVEPFGFRDGISQPLIRGTYKGLRSGDPLHLVAPGEFILGYHDNRGNLPPTPSMDAMYDPRNELPMADGGGDSSWESVNHRHDVAGNGSYLVIRQLEQDVAAFDDYCAKEATGLAGDLPPPYHVTADFIAAKLVGRWKNGDPLVRYPFAPSGPPAPQPENRFELGIEDPDGLRCPFGAHIRRANPRESLDPGSAAQVAISNRHRIIRVGRSYAPRPGQGRGLLFMCLNGDLERQFEFVQQTWLLGNVISLSTAITLTGERDPIVGLGAAGYDGFTIPTESRQIKLSPMRRFVTTRGGGYFFLPGQRLIRHLSIDA